MKRLGLIVAVATLLMIGGQVEGLAQKPPVASKLSFQNLAPDICQALGAFIASVDVASTEADSEERKKKYADAETKLLVILNKHKLVHLSQQASAYVRCSEQAAHGDPSVPDFPNVVANKLAIRSSFVERCGSHTPAP